MVARRTGYAQVGRVASTTGETSDVLVPELSQPSVNMPIPMNLYTRPIPLSCVKISKEYSCGCGKLDQVPGTTAGQNGIERRYPDRP